MLSVSCARAFATSLVSSRAEIPDGQDGFAPDLVEFLQLDWSEWRANGFFLQQ